MPARSRLSLTQEVEVVRRYRKGESARALAVCFGIAIQTACNILHRHKVKIRPKHPELPPATYDIRPVKIDVVKEMCEQFHSYASAGSIATYAFAVFENEIPVVVFAWQPPPPGAAQAACPEAPEGVLALSRMVAVPKSKRQLRHISKPLRRQMKYLIDRTRWPVLITYSDEGQGHTGHVYKCSGWHPTERSKHIFYVDKEGRRASHITSEQENDRGLKQQGRTILQRWEHRICPPGTAKEWMSRNGWYRAKIPGRTWRSGNPAYCWRRKIRRQSLPTPLPTTNTPTTA